MLNKIFVCFVLWLYLYFLLQNSKFRAMPSTASSNRCMLQNIYRTGSCIICWAQQKMQYIWYLRTFHINYSYRYVVLYVDTRDSGECILPTWPIKECKQFKDDHRPCTTHHLYKLESLRPTDASIKICLPCIRWFLRRGFLYLFPIDPWTFICINLNLNILLMISKLTCHYWFYREDFKIVFRLVCFTVWTPSARTPCMDPWTFIWAWKSI